MRAECWSFGNAISRSVHTCEAWGTLRAPLETLLAQRLRVYTRTTLLIHVVLRVSTLSPKHAVHALSLKYNARPLWPEGTLVDDRA